MSRYPENKLSFAPGDNGKTRITVSGYEAQTGARMSMPTEFSQEKVRQMVEVLCRLAGLPEPWKKG